MGLDVIRDTLRHRWGTLPGDAISRLLYYDIEYEGGWESQPTPHIPFDSADFGVELQLVSGSSLSIRWDRELVQYGLAIVDGSLSSFLRHFARYDVSTQPRWAPNLHQRIESVELLWKISDLEEERGPYVQTAGLMLTGGAQVYFSAAEFRPPRVLTMMDNVLIAFSKEVAQNSGLLLDDNIEHIHSDGV